MVKCVKSACYESPMKYGVYTILLNLLVIAKNLHILSKLLDLLMGNLGMSLINLMNNLGGFYG